MKLKKELTLNQKILEILKYYHYDQYSKNSYFNNVAKKIEKLFEEEQKEKRILGWDSTDVL